MAYTGSVDLISGIRPKNDGSFPLVDAKDVYVTDEKRLDAALEEKADADAVIPRPEESGSEGQQLRISNSGAPEWADPIVPTDAQVAEALTDFLEDNPSYVIADGAITYEKLDANLQQKTDEIGELKSTFASRYIGKKISIIGASIDTFDAPGYKIDGYRMYYPALGVTTVEQTWWYQVIAASGATLEVNASWSGSRATDTHADPTYPDFYDRINAIGDPDLVLVTLGSNDSRNNVALGSYDFDTDYTQLSESTFRTAYIKGIKGLQAAHPDAHIVCIAQQMADKYRESIKYIADTLGADFVDTGDYVGALDVHPGPYGMDQIARLMLYPTDKTLTQEHVPADAMAVKNALDSAAAAVDDRFSDVDADIDDRFSDVEDQIAPIAESLDFDLKHSADFTGAYYVNQNGIMNNSAKWEMYGFFLANFGGIVSEIKGYSNYDYYYQVAFYNSDDRWGLNADTFIADGSITFSAADAESVILGLTIPEGAKTMVICNRVESGAGEIKGYTRMSSVAQDIADLSDYVKYQLKNSPYSYRGAKISFGNKLDYNLLITTASAQGACCANDKLFRFNTNGTFNVYDLESKTNLGTFGIAGVPAAPHANVAFWGTEKYDESDPYPIVFVNAYNNTALPKGALYGLRITEGEGTYAMELVQTILIGFADDPIWTEPGDLRPYGNFVLDEKNNILYAYTILDTSQVTRFFAFTMPTLESGDKTFAQSDILYRFDVPYIKYPQDNHFDCGNVYIGSGFGDNASPSRIYVVNMAAQAIASIVDFAAIGLPGGVNEPNCMFDYGGKLCCGKENVYQFTF